jgi:3-methylcrotonyl-CoA carboxylase alpha subunit
LPKRQDELNIDGWAMEARLYAEDPAKGFLPSIGKLELLQFGEAEGGRIDTGVYEGAEVSPFYDPMIAKVIAWGEDRDEARERLSDMLSDSAVWPVKTNASFLVKALDHPDFVAGTVDTGLIGRDGEAMAGVPAPSREVLEAAAASLVPAYDTPGLRLNAAPVRKAWFLLDGQELEIAFAQGSDEPAGSVLITEQGQAWQLAPWRREGVHGAATGSGAILAPMPGKVIAVEVEAGQAVTAGQKLLTLEAMKMEHTLTAPFDGIVAELNAQAGQQVQVEAVLARIEETE